MKNLESWSRLFFFTVVGAALAVIMFVDHRIAIKFHADIKASDLITTVLAALAVMLAVLAAFLAAMALFSWRNFGTKVRSHVEDYLQDFLKPTERYEAVRDLIEDHKEKSRKLIETEKQLENMSNFDEDAV